jgi:hypothetical protein
MKAALERVVFLKKRIYEEKGRLIAAGGKKAGRTRILTELCQRELSEYPNQPFSPSGLKKPIN